MGGGFEVWRCSVDIGSPSKPSPAAHRQRRSLRSCSRHHENKEKRKNNTGPDWRRRAGPVRGTGVRPLGGDFAPPKPVISLIYDRPRAHRTASREARSQRGQLCEPLSACRTWAQERVEGAKLAERPAEVRAAAARCPVRGPALDPRSGPGQGNRIAQHRADWAERDRTPPDPEVRHPPDPGPISKQCSLLRGSPGPPFLPPTRPCRAAPRRGDNSA